MPSRSAPFVYVSGPLQAAADLAAARHLYECVAGVCRDAGWDVYLPHQQTDPVAHANASPAEVFKRDYRKIREAALIIAHVGPPSSGVGAELGIAYEHGIPVIALFRSDERPSRFITGMFASTGLPMVVFNDESDCTVQLATVLRRFSDLRRRQRSRRLRRQRHAATA